MIIKSYSELIKLQTFEERFKYLKLNSTIGEETFGHNRYLNQQLYRSNKWKAFREKIIIRDNGCDLGINGYNINTFIIIHHINPISIDDIIKSRYNIFDPENVICVSKKTHNALHYSNEDFLNFNKIPIRSKDDTILWR